MLEISSRLRTGLCVGNLIAAAVLGAAGYALPFRFWGVDAPLALTLLALVVSAGAGFAKLPWAGIALRVAAWMLFALGLILVSSAALSMSFLIGVHGEFGRMGALVMGLVLAFVVPYGLAYPVFQLGYALRRRERGDTA